MSRKHLLLPILALAVVSCNSLPRVLISTDIGGTDPDDNQSMTHLLMFSDRIALEGLVSTPSYGDGSASEILRMTDLYEQDFPTLKDAFPGLMTPDALRSITKQGRHGMPSWKGFSEPTEGSEWIIECARKPSRKPLWVLVWGGLEDLAQALHDAPDIKNNIKVYWIGGPNKKWGNAAYAYIVRNFPDLWIIENNASYRGFIGDKNVPGHYQSSYYADCIKGAGELGKDFINYLGGNLKMGDTPSLLYMMDGNPDDPEGVSWGGSFERMSLSPISIFHRDLNVCDTIPEYSILEVFYEGPDIDCPEDSPCFSVTIDKQVWPGYRTGPGEFAFRYSPKRPDTLEYAISSEMLPWLDGRTGHFVASVAWPDAERSNAPVSVGPNWFTDRSDPELFTDDLQGYKTVSEWRNAVLDDWAARWDVLRKKAK